MFYLWAFRVGNDIRPGKPRGVVLALLGTAIYFSWDKNRAEACQVSQKASLLGRDCMYVSLAAFLLEGQEFFCNYVVS